jgi:RHS repeat-associated protein
LQGYTFDAEERVSSTSGSLGSASYTYDARGQRITKTIGGAPRDYVYDTAGNVLAEMTSAGWQVGHVYLGGELIAEYNNGTTYFVTKDHLGSTRLVTALNQSVYDSLDYLPFGQQIAGAAATSHKFTSKERDAESNLDNFGARYNSSSLGRFMSPDPLGGKLVDPQTLNKYGYVINNPLRYTDPTGLYTCKDDNNQCKTKQDIKFETARQADLARGGDAARAAAAYGDPTKDNHVSVGFADLDKKGEGGVTTSTLGADDKGNLFAQSDVTINSKLSGTALDAAVGHEGSHVADAQDVVSSIAITEGGQNFKVGQDITRYQSEQRAYAVTDSILKAGNENWHFACGFTDCILGTGLQMFAQRAAVIDQLMANSPLYRSNGQPLSSTNQGGSVVNGLVVPH